MENVQVQLKQAVAEALATLYQLEQAAESVQFQQTRKDFEGDLTLVVFPYLKASKKKPQDTAEEIGSYLKEQGFISDFNVVNGFLNLLLGEEKLIEQLNTIAATKDYGLKAVTGDSPLVMIEYSSPNTNKPLHLGHIRNNLLGFSLAKVMEANGNKVVKTNIVNDRGIHICKSMLAWQKWGEGETPESTGMKGDHLIGKYYVKFDQEYKKELANLQAQGITKEDAEKASVLMSEAREMLRKWEAKNDEVYTLWKTMNSWVYTGFDETYKALGVAFDKIYYESDTYIEGKEKVLEGLEKGAFYRREDGSVWADLTKDGLDEKILLRSDGTSVYMTQDIGTAKLRYEDYTIDKMIYVVGNEQNYHFQVLSILLDKLGFEWGKDLVHFSYGMVELPEGKMKSREGTVVDADDLIKDMTNTARKVSLELGKLEGFSDEEAANIFRIVALGALKYFILKVDPRKNMTFNPKESIDFNGNTGPFLQYTYARIQSVLRKAADGGIAVSGKADPDIELNEKESIVIKRLSNFPQVVKSAGDNYSPALIANYAYELVKEYNQFYHDCTILGEEDEKKKQLRLMISKTTGKTVETALSLLGIEVPERM